MCDSERGLCEEAAQSGGGGGGSVFLGGCVEKWVVLRCMDRYAEAGTVEEGEGF